MIVANAFDDGVVDSTERFPVQLAHVTRLLRDRHCQGSAAVKVQKFGLGPDNRRHEGDKTCCLQYRTSVQALD